MRAWVAAGITKEDLAAARRSGEAVKEHSAFMSKVDLDGEHIAREDRGDFDPRSSEAVAGHHPECSWTPGNDECCSCAGRGPVPRPNEAGPCTALLTAKMAGSVSIVQICKLTHGHGGIHESSDGVQFWLGDAPRTPEAMSDRFAGGKHCRGPGCDDFNERGSTMRLRENTPTQFEMQSDLRPIFEPDPAQLQARLRRTMRELPSSKDVLSAIISALRDAQIENNRVSAILIGGRWFAALDRTHAEYLTNGEGEAIRIFCDSEMERGVRLVYERGDALIRWIAKCVAVDDKAPLPGMADLASRAPSNDADLAVLADWLEETGQVDDAQTLRAAQRGFQVLARLTTVPRHGDPETR